MSYTVEVTSVKPEGVAWFSEVNPANFDSYTAWLATLPEAVITTTRPDVNTIVRTYVFENEAAYNNFRDAHLANEDVQLRQDYNVANGITIETRVVGA